jgi:hypothetical protein
MALPGTKSPSRTPAKSGAGTKLSCAPGCKTIKEESLRFDQAADINKAPPSRIYTRDYAKQGRTAGDDDLVTAALGNPFRI